MVPAVLWLLTLQGLALVTLPLTVRVFGGLPDRGYGLGRVVGLVAVGWLAYLTAMLGFTAYVGPTVAVLALLLGGGLWFAWGRACITTVRERWRLVAAEELTFLVVFGLATFVRAYNADIVGQEKFMDYAFVNALLRTTTLPAEDMWLSGNAMPYYYFGYLLVGLPAKIAQTPGPMAYSLAMVLVFSCGFGAAVSIVYGVVASAVPDNLPVVSGRRMSVAAFLAGLLGGTLTMVVGNLVGALEIVAARGWGSPEFWTAVGVKGLKPELSPTFWPVDGGWWWRSSRVIANIPPDGITEFPYFSFILGDLHPHYVAIPFVLLVVGLAASRWLDQESAPDLPTLLFGGLALATLIPASTWDVPTFWGIYALALLVDAWRREGSREKWMARLPALLIPVAVAAVVVVPYFVGFQSQPLALDVVRERTPLISMLILFGPALLVAVVLTTWLTCRAVGVIDDLRTVLGRELLVIGVLLVGLSAVGEATLALLSAVLLALLAVGLVFLAHPQQAASIEPSLDLEPVTAENAPTCSSGVLRSSGATTGRSAIGGSATVVSLAPKLDTAVESAPCEPGAVLPTPVLRPVIAPAALFCWLLMTWALCVLVGVELIYLKDVFGSRMNTVFKFQYHAWLLVGLASAATLGLIWRSRPISVPWRATALAVAAIILLPGLAYPIGATWTKSGGFRGEPTLMGDRFLERGSPSDHRAIEWLRQNAVGRPVVAEAVGGDYSDHARVSTFSGLPTIIGWVGHELQWRGQRPDFNPRQQAVDTIYQSQNRDEIMRVAQMYHVQYVFFGNLERTKYGADAQARLDRLFSVVYSRAGTTIYRLETE
jgi:YYY domain-containing protein